ncbi:galectin-4-like [Hoplias malabaricus]|uniref:galectin-4-like n=1 Tax=Hoplias malabaricus TaxID=27720 RepID=UPI00346195E0
MSGLESSSYAKLQISHAVSKPAIPYVGTVSSALKPDTAVCFQGVVPDNGNKFTINFKAGSSNDIAFHFNPHIGQKLALNSYINGQWQSEESASVNPFTKGAAFNMFVIITAEGYEVYVNGVKHCMFKHRLPAENVSQFEITGDVFIHMLGFIEKWSSTSFFMEKQQIVKVESTSSVQLQMSDPVTNPAIPYVGKIPEGLKPNMAVCIQGTVLAQANDFAVNFKTGPSNGDDVAFHFNPRINRKTALNSFQKRGWQREETASVTPFTKGAAFSLLMAVTAEGYEVNVNGTELCTFKHRIPLENVSVLNIRGDVSINIIGFIRDWRKERFSQ